MRRLVQGSWLLTQQLAPTNSDVADSKVVAWYNPESRRWETPAPWSALYHENRHTLKLVGRESVVLSLKPHGTTGAGAPLR